MSRGNRLLSTTGSKANVTGDEHLHLRTPTACANTLPETQGHCDIRVSTIYLPQVSLATHLSTNPFGRMNSWMNCVPTALVWDQTQASGLVVRCVNHYTTVSCVLKADRMQSTYHLSFYYTYFTSFPYITLI